MICTANATLGYGAAEAPMSTPVDVHSQFSSRRRKLSVQVTGRRATGRICTYPRLQPRHVMAGLCHSWFTLQLSYAIAGLCHSWVMPQRQCLMCPCHNTSLATSAAAVTTSVYVGIAGVPINSRSGWQDVLAPGQ